MAPLFLNYLLIAPGESFFMAANEPHAYVAGEIIECMACSDNVVRAGLTSKFKDVTNLVNMLTYTMGGPSIDAGAPEADSRLLRYTPPVPEFEVIMATVPPGETLTMPALSVPAVFIVIAGVGFSSMSDLVPEKAPGVSELLPGKSFLLPANAPPLTFMVAEDQMGPLKVAIAHENLHLSDPTSSSPNSPRGENLAEM